LADAENGLTVAVACLASSFVAVLVHGAAVSRAGVMVEPNHRIEIDDIGHKLPLPRAAALYAL
jgi:hypothetical protein